MTQKKAEQLLLEYMNIQKKIQSLSAHATEIVEELHDLSLRPQDQIEQYKQNILDTQLSVFGYAASTRTISHNRFTILTKGNTELITKFLKSKYYADSNHNAWYTVNMASLEMLDFLFMIFLSKNGEPKLIVLNKQHITQLLNCVNIPEDKRIHLKLNISSSKVEEISSGINYISHVNNFNLLT